MTNCENFKFSFILKIINYLDLKYFISVSHTFSVSALPIPGGAAAICLGLYILPQTHSCTTAGQGCKLRHRFYDRTFRSVVLLVSGMPLYVTVRAGFDGVCGCRSGR